MTEHTHEITPSTVENTSTLNVMNWLRQKKAAAGIVFGAAALSLAGCTSAEAVHTPEHSTSATPEAKKPENDPTTAEQIKKLQIPAGLSTDQLGQTVLSRFSDWLMADNDSAWNQYLKAAPTVGAGQKGAETFALTQAKKNAKVYGPALFGPDYESNPSLATIVNEFTNMNALALAMEVETPTTQSGNSVPYSEQLNYVSTTPGATSETITIAYSKQDNASQNNVGISNAKAGVKDPNGETGTVTLTVQTNGDSVVITSMTPIVY